MADQVERYVLADGERRGEPANSEEIAAGLAVRESELDRAPTREELADALQAAQARVAALDLELAKVKREGDDELEKLLGVHMAQVADYAGLQSEHHLLEEERDALRERVADLEDALDRIHAANCVRDGSPHSVCNCSCDEVRAIADAAASPRPERAGVLAMVPPWPHVRCGKCGTSTVTDPGATVGAECERCPKCGWICVHHLTLSVPKDVCVQPPPLGSGLPTAELPELGAGGVDDALNALVEKGHLEVVMVGGEKRYRPTLQGTELVRRMSAPMAQCVFCGEIAAALPTREAEFERWREHALKCSKHPMRALEIQLAAARRERDAARVKALDDAKEIASRWIVRRQDPPHTDRLLIRGRWEGEMNSAKQIEAGIATLIGAAAALPAKAPPPVEVREGR